MVMLFCLGTDAKNAHISYKCYSKTNSFHLNQLNPRLQRAKRGMCGFRTHCRMNKEMTRNATNLLQISSGGFAGFVCLFCFQKDTGCFGTGLKPMLFLSQPPECWSCSHMSPPSSGRACFASAHYSSTSIPSAHALLENILVFFFYVFEHHT